ncbi:MAG: NAD-dependent epimerase/dehydratase family protein [Chitinivibrionales bacterium]|nr:NAD-dependent epimerase/dehydratase family protein [Chitinivibrionales bacterium]
MSPVTDIAAMDSRRNGMTLSGGGGSVVTLIFSVCGVQRSNRLGMSFKIRSANDPGFSAGLPRTRYTCLVTEGLRRIRAMSEQHHGNAHNSAITVLVTGGAGFVGQALVGELLATDSRLPVSEIRVFDVREASFTDSRVHMLRGDIRDRQAVRAAVAGVQVVFHLAAIVDWGTHPRAEVFGVNIDGTTHVIDACREHGVRVLVQTSSLDAICDGTPIHDADESRPYPPRWPNAYCESKARAEQLVIAANGDTLRTTALRPCDVFGEGDPYHVSALVEMARRRPYVRIGDGTARCQHVYVGNVAHALVLAAAALLDGNTAPAGNAYFITDSPPSNFFTFFDAIVEQAGYRIVPPNLWIPRRLMYVLGCIAEAAAWILRPVHRFNPKISRFAVDYTCNDFTLNGDRARRDFDFAPKYGEQEAISRTAAYFREHGPVVRVQHPAPINATE